jgi:hypothetical protein
VLFIWAINTVPHISRFAFRPARRVPKLTRGQIRARHQFAPDETRIRQGGRSRAGSCQLVFSDESRFAKNAEPWVWRRKWESEGAFLEAEQFAPSLMVFAAFGKGCESKLFIIEGSLSQDRHIAMLEEIHLIDECDALFGRGSWRFMQDGAATRGRRRWQR